MKGGALALLLAAAFGPAACGGNPASPSGTAKLGEAFTVDNGGRSARVEGGLEVRFEELLADSRCPVDVNCITAGDAAIQVVVKTSPKGGEARYTLHTRPAGNLPSYADIDAAHRLELVELKPEPRSTVHVPASDYKATLKVTAH